jgi:hypothetical protein
LFCVYKKTPVVATHSVRSLEEAVDESDQRQIMALEWLMLEREQYLECLLQCNALYRRFLCMIPYSD